MNRAQKAAEYHHNKKVLEEKNLFTKKKLSVGTSKFLL